MSESDCGCELDDVHKHDGHDHTHRIEMHDVGVRLGVGPAVDVGEGGGAVCGDSVDVGEGVAATVDVGEAVTSSVLNSSAPMSAAAPKGRRSPSKSSGASTSASTRSIAREAVSVR